MEAIGETDSGFKVEIRNPETTEKNELRGTLCFQKDEDSTLITEENAKISKRRIDEFLSLLGDMEGLDDSEKQEVLTGIIKLKGKAKQIVKDQQEEKTQESKSKELYDEDDSIAENLEVGNKELELNSKTEINVREQEETLVDHRKDAENNIDSEEKLKVYKVTFGEGTEEDEFRMFVEAGDSLHIGKTKAPVKIADLQEEPYRNYIEKKYRELDSDFEGDLDDFLRSQQGYYLKKAPEIKEESKQKVKNLSNNQLKGLIAEYLKGGFEKDSKLQKVLFPHLVKHDRKGTKPQDIMPYNPHNLVFTNSKVGKTYTAEKIGIVRDDVTPAGLCGYISAEETRRGILYNEDETVFADEINFRSDRQMNDEILSLLERGTSKQSKAGKSLLTDFYGDLVYMANPTEDKDNLKPVEKFQYLLEALGRNMQGMGSRFGVVLFDENLEPATGEPMNQDRRRKLSKLVSWLKSEISQKYTEIQQEMVSWLEKEYPEDYRDIVDKLGVNEKMAQFWKSHKESYRHARGHALKMAVLDNIADILNGSYDLDKIEADAESYFEEVLEINKETMAKMDGEVSKQVRIEKAKALVEDQEPLYLKLFVKTAINYQKKDGNSLQEYTALSELEDSWNDLRDDIKEVNENSKYWSWSRIANIIQKKRVDHQEEIQDKYDLYLTEEQGTVMVKKTSFTFFDPFQRIKLTDNVSSNRGRSGKDRSNESSESEEDDRDDQDDQDTSQEDGEKETLETRYRMKCEKDGVWSHRELWEQRDDSMVKIDGDEVEPYSGKITEAFQKGYSCRCPECGEWMTPFEDTTE
jgi:hypothetical protein